MKHTRGPWRIGDSGQTIFGAPNGNPSPEIVASLNRKANHRANAQIIASAPELLFLLQDLVHLRAMGIVELPISFDKDVCKAIRKATGE
ncbi:MAG: hypothetical protein GY861_03030 [bacterium]|nr:hypothetical protein [bacterium]